MVQRPCPDLRGGAQQCAFLPQPRGGAQQCPRLLGRWRDHFPASLSPTAAIDRPNYDFS